MRAMGVCRPRQHADHIGLSTSLGAVRPRQNEVTSKETFRSGSLDDGEHATERETPASVTDDVEIEP